MAVPLDFLTVLSTMPKCREIFPIAIQCESVHNDFMRNLIALMVAGLLSILRAGAQDGGNNSVPPPAQESRFSFGSSYVCPKDSMQLILDSRSRIRPRTWLEIARVSNARQEAQWRRVEIWKRCMQVRDSYDSHMIEIEYQGLSSKVLREY